MHLDSQRLIEVEECPFCIALMLVTVGGSRGYEPKESRNSNEPEELECLRILIEHRVLYELAVRYQLSIYVHNLVKVPSEIHNCRHSLLLVKEFYTQAQIQRIS